MRYHNIKYYDRTKANIYIYINVNVLTSLLVKKVLGWIIN